MSDDLDQELAVDVLAASMRLDGHDTTSMLPTLASRFETALPEHCEVERSGGWFSKKEISAVTLKLGDHHYRLAKGHGAALEATCRHVVHGVVLRNDELSMEEWTALVAKALAELAARNAKARRALSMFMQA